MKIKTAFLLLLLVCIVSDAEAQPLYGAYVMVGKNHVVVGDTQVVAENGVYPITGCPCPPNLTLDQTLNEWSLGPDRNIVAQPIFFAPARIGLSILTYQVKMSCVTRGRQCNDTLMTLYDTAFGISDSFPKIRPLPFTRDPVSTYGGGWSISMEPDSSGKFWANHSTPTFDNPIPDTTVFSDFTAHPPNGNVCTLQVFDSTALISEYWAMPFRRKHPLNLTFYSSNYKSFDTIIFSSRMRHGDIDSFISYPLLVTWVAPLGVSQSKTLGQDFALPNPFTTHTTIGFTLSKPEAVKLQLFDITGRRLRETERECNSGTNEIEIDTRDLPPGCYWYLLHGGEWERSGKLVKLAP